MISPFFIIYKIMALLSEISNIIIAIVNLFLAGYIFLYQKSKDADDRDLMNSQIEQSIKLQWFKELIIQPQIEGIYTFYSILLAFESDLNSSDISEDIKFLTSEKVKKEAVNFRRQFCEKLRSVDPDLHQKVQLNIDQLIDQIVSEIFLEGANFSEQGYYESRIGFKILASQNELISTIYKFKGV